MRKPESSHPENNRRIRIIFFDHVASLSGAEIALLNLIRHLDPALVESTVVLGEEGALAERLREVADVHILPMQAGIRQARKDDLGGGTLLQVKSVAASLSYIWRLATFIRQRKCDIVHTNSLKADLLGGLAAKLARKPLVWKVMDRITPDYLPAKVVKAFRLAARWIPDLIITNSRAVASTLSKTPTRRLCVIHEGTPHEEFAAISASTHATDNGTGAPVIGLLGRISPWKGQDIFIRAAGLVHTSFPQAQFRIIGSALFDEAVYENGLHALVNQLGLQDALTFCGFRPDIHQAIAELDILVHASTKPEPFGQVIIEGMAAAKPVVATKAGGVLEIVEDGVTGYLVPMSDPGSMASAITTLLENPEAARAMGQRGQSHVVENFSIEKTARSSMEAYWSLLKSQDSSLRH